MIKIIIETEGKTAEQKIEGLSEKLLLTDIVPSIKKGTPGMAKANSAEVLKSLLSDMLRTFVRQRASLWKDN